MEINEWAKTLYHTSTEHGWWEEPRTFGDIIALCHSELSEALEEYRKNKDMLYYRDVAVGCNFTPNEIKAFGAEGLKPEGIAVEMIDCLIRILEWCEHEGIDVDEIIRIKNKYNESRPYRHGGKKI